MIKKIVYIIIILFGAFHLQGQVVYYVSPLGSDTASGEKNAPFQTVQYALRKIRENRRLYPAQKGHYKILLKDGLYTLKEPISLRPEDGGSEESRTIIQAEKDAHPIISGGVQIKKWRSVNSNDSRFSAAHRSKILEADVKGLPVFRQLWVNDQKAIRAQDARGDSMFRIYSWNKKDRSVKISAGSLKKIKDFSGLEMFIHQWWAIANLRIASCKILGDTAQVWFRSPEDRIQSEHPWPAPWISSSTGNSAYVLVNDIQFLDEPGEWYHDIKQEKLFYYPKKGEININAFAPLLEQLVEIKGSPQQHVSYIQWNGIQFSHATWKKPSERGHVPHQIGMHMLDAYRLNPSGTSYKQSLDNVAWVDRPVAAIYVEYASNIRFSGCIIKHVGATGIDFHKGVHQSLIGANLIKDVGGNGILSGVFSPTDHEIHKPFNPKDQRDINTDILIEDNLISDATNEDWSCVGIGLGFQKKLRVGHNEIEEVSYSGISMGWGWNSEENPNEDNEIASNYIHHFGKHNYDCAGIYNLGSQKGGRIQFNRIDSIYKAKYAHLPTHWFYLYTDEGSSGLQVKDNWTPTAKFLQNANGPGNIWLNNGPSVSENIKNSAGLNNWQPFKAERHYRSISRFQINEQREELVELKFNSVDEVNIDSIKRFLKRYDMDTASVFQWNNHVVIYAMVVDIAVFEGRLLQNFPSASVKIFHDLFYQYDKRDCGIQNITSDSLTNYILTASMKSDSRKQAEYIRLHDTQRIYWPEITKGFCNAGFERLQLFKNGLQLMLVISIPKGKVLEELNPKTIENNPRMVEWNKMMEQYQEGIKDAPTRQTWVFFNQQ